MSEALVALLREAVVLALLLAAPLLVAGLVAGVLAGVLGALTRLEDPVVGQVARAFAVGGAVIAFGPSIARQVQAMAAHGLGLVAGLGAASS